MPPHDCSYPFARRSEFLKIARTLADLDDVDRIEAPHVLEAIKLSVL